MPQLMPMNWICSVFVIYMVFVSAMIFFGKLSFKICNSDFEMNKSSWYW